MQLFIDEVTTARMPHVFPILKVKLPTILKSRCFNEKKLPFSKEVRKTEIGHLFEHILLEYLCKEKINLGHNEAIFSGLTKWNWNKENYGRFHISVDITIEEKDILYSALESSIHLLKQILLVQSTPAIPKTLIRLDSVEASTLLLLTAKKQMD